MTNGKSFKAFPKRAYRSKEVSLRKFAVFVVITLIVITISAEAVNAITTAQNTAPSASRYNPGSNIINLSVGQAQTFTVKGTDPDGNLRGTEWYLNGSYQISHFTLSGTSGIDSWSYTFNTAGTYMVEALVFDSLNAYSSQSAAWTVAVDSAYITSFSPPVGIKNPGNLISSSVTVKNTGTNTKSYWIGLSYQKPDGTWFNVPPQHTNILTPNSQQTLIFNWNLPLNAPSGIYNARATIWNNYNSSANSMIEPKYYQKDALAFTVTSNPFKFQSRALYVWGEASTILQNSTEADSLIQFAKKHNISTLFFYTSTLELSSNPQQFKSLIAKAHNNNLYVHALNGDPTWTTDHQPAASYIDTVISYNKNSQINEKFDGINLDVEPYVLASWEKDSYGNSLTLAESSVNTNLATQYLQLLSIVKNTISTSGETLTFGADIPFWFDANGFGLAYNGDSKLLSSHIQDITDFITIMDYTDNYNNAIAWAANEVNYGVAIGKYVVIAFETQKLDNSGSTFYYDGAAALEYTIVQVNNSFSTKPSFRGFAIHHYGSYRILTGVY